MPSSGYGSVMLVGGPEDQDKAKRLVDRAKLAMRGGLFVEWMESFLAAWEQTHDVDIASWAGLEEWDM